jgi:antitoxin VapB
MSKLELSLFRQRWQETRKHGRQKSSAPSRVSARRSICHWHMHGGGQCLGRGTSDYFRNGRNQAVRIPVEFELPGDEAIMRRDGDRLVIEPVRMRGLVALLKTMKPLEEGFPAIDDPVPAPENVL